MSLQPRRRPDEKTNAALDHPELRQAFRKRVWEQQGKDSLAQPIVLEDRTRARLKALGYVGD
jgi:hypothetical protein